MFCANYVARPVYAYNITGVMLGFHLRDGNLVLGRAEEKTPILISKPLMALWTFCVGS